jgi:hypothetical protein
MKTAFVGYLPVCVLVLFHLQPLHAQEIVPDGVGSVRGIVVSADGASPLPLVNVSIDSTHLGTSTDVSGRFLIRSVPAGQVRVSARLLGYEPWISSVMMLKQGDTLRLRIILKESAIALREIQVTAERERRRNDIRTSVLEMAPARTKTLAGVGEDVMRSLQALPGVLATSDFTSQLAIRGSGPDQNLILMDGIEIFNPYRLYGMISMFNPETASDINLITGGFPAKYGDRLSAVLEVTNREGDRSSPIRGTANVSITNANVILGGALPFGINGSYLVSTRRTYYDLILGPIAKKTGLVSGDVAFPNFADFQTKLVLNPGAGHALIFTGLFSRDGVDLISGSNRKTPDSISVVDHTTNSVAGFAWHYVPSTSFYSKLGISWYANAGDTRFGGDFIDPSLDRRQFENGDTSGLRLYNVEFDSRYEFHKTSFKEEFGWSLPGHAIDAGFFADLLHTGLVWHFRPDSVFRAILQARNVSSLNDLVQDQDYTRMGAFVQDKIAVTDELSIQPGLRLDYYQIIDLAYIQPRVNISYKLDPITTVRAAWGLYRQSPGYEKLLDQNAFVDLSNISNGRLAAEGATHYVLGVDRWLNSEWQALVEGYYKDFSDVIVQQIVQGTVYTTTPVPGGDRRLPSGWTTPVATTGDSLTTIPINGANGHSYGIEFMLEKKNLDPESPFSGWIAYAWSKSERTRNGITSPFRFDQRHTVDVVMDYKVSSVWTVGLRWKYGSGFPYIEPAGIKPRIVMTGTGTPSVPKIEYDRDGHVIFDINRGSEYATYNAWLPAYHRLDVRISAKAGFWGWDWDLYLDIINVYNHGNVYNYRFYQQDDLTIGRSEITMLPILPTLGVSVRF